MKKILPIFLMILVFSVAHSQTTTKSFMWGGTNREYIEHVPAIYTGNEAVPLVVCLHGLGDNMNNFSGIGMHQVANVENFIVLTPQALMATVYMQQVGTAWNSGASYAGIVLNQTVDDKGFISEMINSTKALYNIDVTRIYVCGFSMGGFMSNRLACEMSDEIAAIASVAGTIGGSLSCSPANPISVCHMHGTADSQVPYSGNQYGNDAEVLVDYWVSHNNCNTTPITTALPDNAADGYTIDHYVYENGTSGTEVEFYKVTGADHEWLWEPNNDMTYTTAIWDFFSRHQLSSAVSVNKNVVTDANLKFYPNPANNELFISSKSSAEGELQINDLTGRLLYKGQVVDGITKIDLSLPTGVYVINAIFDEETKTEKLIIE